MIILDQVSFKHGKKQTLNEVSFAVRPGEFVCLFGAGGSGKSTIVNLLIGAEKPSAGIVTIDGVQLDRVPRKALQLYRQRLGIIFQEQQLFWQQTVRENLSFQLELLGASNKVIDRRVQELLTNVKLEERADDLCSTLSGGERELVALGRALAHKPMIVIADEPSGLADSQQTATIFQQLRLRHAEKATVIVATNKQDIAESLGVRIITLNDGQVTGDTNPVQQVQTSEEPQQTEPAPPAAPPAATPVSVQPTGA